MEVIGQRRAASAWQSVRTDGKKKIPSFKTIILPMAKYIVKVQYNSFKQCVCDTIIKKLLT
jgi:hypothetical protein